MRTENGLNLDLQQLFETIDQCDVLVLGFLHIGPRVLFDSRHDAAGAPLLRFVPPVRTPRERFAHLRRLRPSLGDPERYAWVQWPLGIESLVGMGTWARVVQHCSLAAGDRAVVDCEEILDRLRLLERKEVTEAISGAGYRTLWPAPRPRRGGR